METVIGMILGALIYSYFAQPVLPPPPTQREDVEKESDGVSSRLLALGPADGVVSQLDVGIVRQRLRPHTALGARNEDN